MSGFVEQITDAVRAVTIVSPTRVLWFGQRIEQPGGSGRQQLAVVEPRQHLLALVVQCLYADFYQSGGAQPSSGPTSVHDESARSTSFGIPSTVGTGGGHPQHDWVVREISPPTIAVERSGLMVRVSLDDILSLNRHPLEVGDVVAMRLPNHLPDLVPGFMTVLGHERLSGDATDHVRVYWNVTPGVVPLFIRSISDRLDRERLPFELKVARTQAVTARCDAAVLYLARRDVAAAFPILERVYADVATGLRPRVPALTRPIAAGVGLAEDPGTGESFGMQRCRLLAEGIVRAWEAGERRLDGRMRVVAETWAENGVSFEQPYLNPGSTDDDIIAWTSPPPPIRRSSDSTDLGDALLERAATIGQRLVSDAIWHGDRCTWLGITTGPATSHSVTTLSPTLYDGTAGVALFLAELHMATHDEGARATALGAIRQAIATHDRIAAPVQLGHYTGVTGLIWSVARLGRLLDAPEFLDAAGDLLRFLPELCAQPHELDLLSGTAGAILSLLQLHQQVLTGDSSLLATAVQLGDELVDLAVVDGRGWRWRSSASPHALPLTGYAHGASGIAHALLALTAATSEDRFRTAALGAFEWERSWYDAASGGWPDFRDVAPAALRRRLTLPSSAFWCHGASGIALARLAGWQQLGDERLRDDASHALSITRQVVEEALADPAASRCLCHGLAGNARVLDLGANVLRDHHLEEMARMAWSVLAGMDIADDLRVAPGLMTGMSGVGLACLQAAGYPTADVLTF